jgi:hypothetical protein
MRRRVEQLTDAAVTISIAVSFTVAVAVSFTVAVAITVSFAVAHDGDDVLYRRGESELPARRP